MAGEDTLRQPAAASETDRVASIEGAADHNEELVADVLAGDRKAIAELVDTFADTVYRFLSCRIDRPEIVDELCQDVFLAAWPQLARFRKEAGLATWLCAIARHKVADFYRRRLQEVPQDDIGDEKLSIHDEFVEIVDFERHADGQRSDSRVRKILLRMPEQQRSILRWRYWDHRSLGEIAAMTGKTEKAMERLLARSRQNFARRWNLE